MDKLRILVSLTTDDNDYQIEQAQSAEQMARKLGVEIQSFTRITTRLRKAPRF